jgi:hypothetical protein
MLLSPIVEGLADDLRRAAAVGGDETRRAADVLIDALGSAVRLRLLDALQQATEEFEMRLQGLDPVLSVVVSSSSGAARANEGSSGDEEMMRLTLRLPEGLKSQVERAASRDGVSINSWLVDAAAHALRLPPAPRRGSKRMTGFVRG